MVGTAIFSRSQETERTSLRKLGGFVNLLNLPLNRLRR